MADEENLSNTTADPVVQATTATVDPQSVTARFTQDDLNRAAGKAREEGRQRALKELKAEPKAEARVEPKVEATTDPTLRAMQALEAKIAAMEARNAAMEARNEFNRNAKRLNLDDEIANDLFDLQQMQKPENPSEWLTTKAKLFVKESQVTTNNNTIAATAPNVEPKTAAAPAAPVKVDGLTNSGLVDLFTLTHGQIDQLGPAGLREHFEKAVSIGRQTSGAPNRPRLPTKG